MDETYDLTNISREVISSLLLLQVFSKVEDYCNRHYTESSMLEELECLKHITNISIMLTSCHSNQKLLSSPKLERCIRRRAIVYCKDLTLLAVSSSSMRRMKHLETLVFDECSFEQLKIYSDNEDTMQEFVPKHISMEHGCFHRLRHLSVGECPNIINLTWLFMLRAFRLFM